MKKKELTKSQFFQMVNGEAIKLHLLQGQTLSSFELGLSSVYFEAVLDRLTYLYQKNFTATVKGKRDGGKGSWYVVFPEEKTKERPLVKPIFEVEWLVTALLGLALARQALVIHRVPRGREPENADAKLVDMVQLFLKETDPEEVLARKEYSHENSGN